ncbi:MAG: hypothetical protein FWG73_02760 [Planctomycetaceae bacterium]|nr:hypothetical protein [Planctomycetaceae bacterium]
MKRLLFLLLFALPFTLLGEEVPRPAVDTFRPIPPSWPSERPEGVTGSYRKLTVSPQLLPDPMLRYRLNIFATEKETGNAYPLHLAAQKEFNSRLEQAMRGLYPSDEYLNLEPEKRNDWRELERLRFKRFPLYFHWSRESYSEITAEDEARLYRSLERVYSLLEKASKRTHFDWSDEYQYAGIATLLEPIQEARAISRYLASKANWEIRNGDYDSALRTIRVGLAQADHILESQPTSFLVGMLVGIAIKGAMYEQLFLLSAQPDAPNLYPALMQIRIDERVWINAIQSETHWLFSQYHADAFWASLDSLSPEQAKTLLDDLFALVVGAGDVVAANEEAASLFMTMMNLVSYVPARNRLLQKGFSEQEIEARTTYQIVAPFVFEELKRTYDLMLVDASMPAGESRTAINFEESVEFGRSNYAADYLIALLAPATNAARNAFNRQQQTLDLLRIVHAVRYYAAVHDGKLPTSLDEITELAVPKICPVTATPYQYRVEGNTVIIDHMEASSRARLEFRVE